MSKDIKAFIFNRGENAALDKEFENAASFDHVKLGENHIFWRRGFRWYVIATEQVTRAYRRVEEVESRVCCGKVNFEIQKLMLILNEGDTLEIRIGDDTKREAEELYSALRNSHPQLQYGKAQ